jgi:hypothetical protein
MKGEALITIKDKNGKIKQQVKETNVVFDIPKELTKKMIENADLELGTTENGFSNATTADMSSMLSVITAYEDWFRSIKINDEECSEVDFKDWKMPVLFGGEIASANSNRKRYAYYDTANSSKTGNLLKKSYTWNDCPAFTLKSINLCHYVASTSQSRASVMTILGYQTIMKKGIFLWWNNEANNSGNTKGMAFNQLARKNGFTWESGKGRAAIITKRVGPTGNNNYNYQYYRKPHIIPLKGDEIAVLTADADYTNEANNNSSAVKYLSIIDSTNGNVKRSFPLTQFDGFVGYTSSNHYITSDYVQIVATDFGSFIVMSKTNSASNLFIWKIPEQSEMENYSNNEAIPVYADLTSISGISIATNTCVVVNEFLIFTADFGNEHTIRINNDAQNPYTLYNYAPFNMTNGSSNSQYSSSNVNKYADAISGGGYFALPKWYNTTALNLSGGGVSVSAGDTITIEYTITAN